MTSLGKQHTFVCICEGNPVTCGLICTNKCEWESPTFSYSKGNCIGVGEEESL